MSWLYEPERPVPTKHNGTMRLSRLFGVWRLRGHDGTEQATPYMDALWRKVLRAAAGRGLVVRRALVLGVAMGSTFGLIEERWPLADLVGVDWEPAILKLGIDLGVFAPRTNVRFIEGDALAVVPKLEGAFDLALVDLFNGEKVADAVADPRLADAVAAKLASGGIVAVNRFREPAVLAPWKARLGEPALVRYKGNGIAVFGKK